MHKKKGKEEERRRRRERGINIPNYGCIFPREREREREFREVIVGVCDKVVRPWMGRCEIIIKR